MALATSFNSPTGIAQDFAGLPIPGLSPTTPNHYAVQTLIDLAALDIPADKSLVFVEDEQGWFYFDAESLAAPTNTPTQAEDVVVLPDALTLLDPGRWVISQAAGGTGVFDVAYSATPPLTDLFNGRLWVNTDRSLLYAWDSQRSKWLSPDELRLVAGRGATNVTNVYLRGVDSTATNLVSFRLDDDYTLVRLQAAHDVAQNFSWVAQIRINGLVAPVASVAVVNANQAVDNTLNVDLVSGDLVQMYLLGDKIDYPRIDAFFKRRGS